MQTTRVGEKNDTVARLFRVASEHIVSFVFGVLPLVFVPVVVLPIEYTKTVFVAGALAVAFLLFGLAMLRLGRITLAAAPPVLFLWLAVVSTGISAVVSGDVMDSLVGDQFETQTTAFVFLLALTASAFLTIVTSRAVIMRFYMYFIGSAALLALFHIIRIILPVDWVSIHELLGPTMTTVGSWNDLAVFFGLVVLLSIFALEQLPLTPWGRRLFIAGVILSLLMLVVINFTIVWWVLGLVSLVLLLFNLVKDHLMPAPLGNEAHPHHAPSTIFVYGTVFAVAFAFIVAGGPLSTAITKLTGISYLEVRPSLTTTVGVAEGVYAENALFGIGPNKFVDAWRLYKDPAINQTIFWATDFTHGHSYLSTLFITTGIVGGLVWCLFLISIIYTGVRATLSTQPVDRFWYFIGVSSFIATVYLWGMALVCVPGAALLFLAAAFLGVFCVAVQHSSNVPAVTYGVMQGRQTIAVFVGGVLLVIIFAATVLFFLTRHVTSLYAYQSALPQYAPQQSVEEVSAQLVRAHELVQNDTYLKQLAEYQLAKLTALLELPSPTDTDRDVFQRGIVDGVNTAQVAVDRDPSDARAWVLSGRMQSIVAGLGVAEAIERAILALNQARQLSPHDPRIPLLQAQLQSRVGNLAGAEAFAQEAVALKTNYTEALLFLAQLAVASGRTDEAIANVRTIIAYEPRNAARYYQLGVLLSTTADRVEAIGAFEQAIRLNPGYANARYLLGLAYAANGQTDEALAQLLAVLALDPQNQQVQAAIDAVRTTNSVDQVIAPDPVVSESSPVVVDEGAAVTTTTAPDTPLLAPLNAAETTSAAEEL